jgi:hypothetical protein
MSLLALPGVTGVDIGPQVVAGKKTDSLAIRVYVASKQEVPVERQIPAEIEGVPVDVIERRFVLHSDKAALSEEDKPKGEPRSLESALSACHRKEHADENPSGNPTGQGGPGATDL